MDGKHERGRTINRMVSDLIGDRSHDKVKKKTKDREDGGSTEEGSDVWTYLESSIKRVWPTWFQLDTTWHIFFCFILG